MISTIKQKLLNLPSSTFSILQSSIRHSIQGIYRYCESNLITFIAARAIPRSLKHPKTDTKEFEIYREFTEEDVGRTIQLENGMTVQIKREHIGLRVVENEDGSVPDKRDNLLTVKQYPHKKERTARKTKEERLKILENHAISLRYLIENIEEFMNDHDIFDNMPLFEEPLERAYALYKCISESTIWDPACIQQRTEEEIIKEAKNFSAQISQTKEALRSAKDQYLMGLIPEEKIPDITVDRESLAFLRSILRKESKYA